MAKRIRELIDIPEEVHKGDFVLRLAEGIEHPAETLREYVVTDQLVTAFQRALDLVRRGVEGHRSMGAYLHGSFGSGKSHFMAVLHLLLQHNPAARSIEALAPVVARHAWTEGKRFLLVPFHLLGGPDNLEQAVLGHYVEHVRKLHPEAPLPAVYLAEPVFANAQSLRGEMGDERFFARLNRGKAGRSEGWGAFAAGVWNPESFAAAIAAGPNDPRRQTLVSDLVSELFPAYQELAANQGESFVTLDRGLSVISRHAHTLGYDGLVLFLDELVLWLASRVADMAFVTREAAKVAKLVESETADRPVPILSFIARQRDLRELVGDHLPGAEKLSFSDNLKYSEGRFETITLEDRNLPMIAKQRLLTPRNEAARQEIEATFRETLKVRQEVLAALLGREGNPDMFRDVYPFSPVLVTALVAISSMLQRERTALRVMLQLLVNQRETLQLGDLVPIGDLFDVIAEGDEPFTEEMRIHFAQARRLYVQKLLPLLEKQHKMTRDEVRRRPHDDPAAFAFRGDDRLLKTLLLAALTPEVEAFVGMTASRLAALNHGSIRSPIPGAETKAVLNRCRGWASQVGEIKIGEDPGNSNPTISLQLSGVDTEGILEKVRSIDNDGNRKRVVRQLLAAELGLAPGEDDSLIPVHPFLWRGTQRQAEVVFANLRETPHDLLRARLGGGDWKVIVDLPFDSDGYSAKDDLARVNEFRADEADIATLCWVPAFFTHEALRDLGTYVVLDHLLNGERFNEAASHLSQVDRAAARALLDNQRSQLKQRMISCLEAAYGVSGHAAGLVDSSFDLADRFQSLDRRFEPRPPAAANLREALANLLDQIQSYRFPRHPKFETRVQLKDLRRVLEVALRAAHAPQGRVEVEKERDLRSLMRQIANPLGLGEMHEAVFLLSDRWRNELTRAAAAIGGKVTVGRLRDALEQPEPLGLPREVKDLLILVFAEQTNRSFFLSGGPVAAELGGLQEDFELREQTLPDTATWSAARERAATLFGLAPSSILSASNVSALREELQTKAAGLRGPLSELVGELRQWLAAFGGGPGTAVGETPARLRTAEALLTVVEALAEARAEEALERLATATLATSGAAMANAGMRAAEVVTALRNPQVAVLTTLREMGTEWQGEAGAILDRLREALTHDELAVPLAPAVTRAVADGLRLLARATRRDDATTAPATAAAPGAVGARREWSVVERDAREGLDAAGAAALFREIEERLRAEAGRRLRIEWTVEARTETGTDGE
jgi:hypothetical protein